MRNLIDINGYSSLEPLLQFRDWLAKMRDEPRNRRKRRRNGTLGLGPLTISARKHILRRLQRAEREAGMTLLPPIELTAIRALWQRDD
jgi:DNA sulfur modification protein DndC